MFLIGCQPSKTTVYDPNYFSSGSGILKHNGTEFSGVLIKEINKGIQKTSYKYGKKHGFQKIYSSKNKLILKEHFKDGRCFGRQQKWYENGQKRSDYFCNKYGKNGSFQYWFSNGQLYKDFNFKNGKEEGIQKMWFRNGQLKANYVMKDGRRFGILGVKLCQPQNRLKRGKNSDT
jgi:antitoxin component YwqK of YwqJK toxin-antitoxin module